jgi:hypothetical protein
MNCSTRSAKTRPRAGKGSRQVTVVMAIGASLALGAFGADKFIMAAHNKAAAGGGAERRRNLHRLDPVHAGYQQRLPSVAIRQSQWAIHR